jgi:hypothetical protein
LCSDLGVFAFSSKKYFPLPRRYRHGYFKRLPLPRRTATAISKILPLPHRYRRGGGGAAAVRWR